MSTQHKNCSIRCKDKEWGAEIASGLIELMDAGAIVVISNDTITVDMHRHAFYDKGEAGSPEGAVDIVPPVLQ